MFYTDDFVSCSPEPIATLLVLSLVKTFVVTDNLLVSDKGVLKGGGAWGLNPPL